MNTIMPTPEEIMEEVNTLIAFLDEGNTPLWLAEAFMALVLRIPWDDPEEAVHTLVYQAFLIGVLCERRGWPLVRG